MLKKRNITNLKWNSIIDDISQILLQVNCSVSYCFREANQVVDGLLNVVGFLQIMEHQKDSKVLIENVSTFFY